MAIKISGNIIGQSFPHADIVIPATVTYKDGQQHVKPFTLKECPEDVLRVLARQARGGEFQIEFTGKHVKLAENILSTDKPPRPARKAGSKSTRTLPGAPDDVAAPAPPAAEGEDDDDDGEELEPDK